ncbi:hypothetical protein ACTFIU_005214 [Dictyostelium citrinum]
MNLEEPISNNFILNSLLNQTPPPHQLQQNESIKSIDKNNDKDNEQSLTELECEYSICAMFSIYYPIIKNFEIFSISNEENNDCSMNISSNNNNNYNNNNSSQFSKNEDENFIPKLVNPISWGELTDSESIYSTSPSSSMHSFSDFDDTNTNGNHSKNNNKNKINSQKNDKKNNNNSEKQKNEGIKKLFVGGINFDDLKGNEQLKQIRIQKLINLFQSFGYVVKTSYHWDKGYSKNKVSQFVVDSFSTTKKRQKYIDKIKESLKDSEKCAAPQLNFYVRFPSNYSSVGKNNNGSNQKKQ